MVDFVEKEDKDYCYVFKRRRDGSAGKLLGKVSKAEDDIGIIMKQIEQIKNIEQERSDRIAANNRRRRKNFTPEQKEKEKNYNKEYINKNKHMLYPKRVEDQKIQRAFEREEKKMLKNVEWREKHKKLKDEVNLLFNGRPISQEELEENKRYKKLKRLLKRINKEKEMMEEIKEAGYGEEIEDMEDFYRYF